MSSATSSPASVEGRRSMAWELVVVAAILLASTALRGWAVAGGWFHGDDVIFLVDNARGHDGASWLFQRHDSHFMPVGLGLTWLVSAAGAYSWTAVTVQVLMVHVLSVLACWALLRQAFGPTIHSMILLAAYATSSLVMPGAMWWAASLNVLTVQVPVLLALTFHLMYLRGRRRLFAFLSVAMYVLALGCYIKAVFLPIVLFTMTWAYFSRGAGWSRFFATLRRHLWLWAAYFGVSLAFAALYLSLDGEPRTGKSPSFVAVADLFSQQLLVNLVTGVVGGPWHWVLTSINSPRQLAEPPVVGIVGAWILLLFIVALGYIQRRGTLRALSILAVPLVGTVVVLAAGRLGVFAAATTQEMRYLTDIAPYLVLFLGIASGARLLGSDSNVDRPEPLLVLPPSVRFRFVLGVTAVVLIGNVTSSITYASTWHSDNYGRGYVGALRSQLNSSDVPLRIADGLVPGPVVEPLLTPENSLDRFLSPFGKKADVVQAGNDLQIPDSLGLLSRAKVSPDFVVAPKRLDRCLQGNDTVQAIQLGGTTFDYPFWASLTYRSTADADTLIVAGSERQRTELLEGRHMLTFRTNGALTEISVLVPRGVTLCPIALIIGKDLAP